jgi:hypothetical protein
MKEKFLSDVVLCYLGDLFLFNQATVLILFSFLDKNIKNNSTEEIQFVIHKQQVQIRRTESYQLVPCCDWPIRFDIGPLEE